MAYLLKTIGATIFGGGVGGTIGFVVSLPIAQFFFTTAENGDNPVNYALYIIGYSSILAGTGTGIITGATSTLASRLAATACGALTRRITAKNTPKFIPCFAKKDEN